MQERRQPDTKSEDDHRLGSGKQQAHQSTDEGHHAGNKHAGNKPAPRGGGVLGELDETARPLD
jgi:hypothetical protein